MQTIFRYCGYGMAKKVNSCPSRFPAHQRLKAALKEYFGFCLYRSGLHFRNMIEEALTDYGVVPPQFGILALLRQEGALSQVDLSLTMGIDKASVVKFVDGLEKLGYVARAQHKSDRRVNLIELTSKGRAAFSKAQKVVRDVEDGFFSGLSSKEIQFLRQTLPKLVK